MGERHRIAVQRSAIVPAAREQRTAPRTRADRHESEATALRHMMAAGALQPRLTVGPADDPYEREAEQTADVVMGPDGAMRAGAVDARHVGIAAGLSRVVRRAMGKIDPPTKKDEEKRKDDDKKDDDQKRIAQRASAGAGPSVVPTGVAHTIETTTASGGSPLPPALRSKFEPRFGYDFDRVRVHTDGRAVGAATALSARAFTVGDHLFFGAGEYQPTSTEGQRLIAHELTHVVQQSADPTRIRRRPILSWQLGGTTFFKSRTGEVVELPEDMTVEQVAKLEDEAIAAERRLAELPPPKPVPEVHKPAPKPVETKAPRPKPRAKRRAGKAPPKAAEAAAALMKAVGGGKVAQYLAAKGGPVFAQGAAKLSRLRSNEQTHEDGGEKLKKAEDAVVIPTSEEQSTANAGQVSVVGDRPAPVVDDSKGKKTLAQSLAANVPKSIGVLDNFQRDKKAQHTGAEVLEVVQGDRNTVVETFGDVRLTPAPVPSGHEPVQLPPPEGAPPTPAMHLGRGAIAPLQKEHTDVSDYTRQADAKLKEEGVSQEQLDMVDSGDLAEANKEKKGMAKVAATEPLAVQKMANDERKHVDTELVREEQSERSVLAGRRKSALATTGTKQKDTKTALEKKREAVAKDINDRYKLVQDKVNKRLADLDTESMKRFDDGNAAAARDFEANVKRELDEYKKDRYSGWFGWARKAKDWLLGMDELPRVKAIFENNRAAFVKRVEKLVEDIAADNARVVRECKEELVTAKQKIDEYVAGLEPGLQDIGKKAAAEMDEKLAELDKTISRKEEELREKLKEKQTAAIKAIDEKIEKMKEAMSGALAKVGRLLLYAAKKFFTWALEKFGFSLSTIETIINKGVAVLKAIFTHPIQFVKNLIGAAKTGFLSFAKNFVTHLKDAVFDWLTGSLEGISLPESWTLKGIVSVLFQIVGLTWVNIKKALVKLIPEPVVEGLKTTFGLVKTLVAEGPMAAWEQVKEMAEELKKSFVSALTDWIKWKVVEEAVKTIIALFVPGAGIVRAIIAIYDTIVFFIQKAKDIMQMIGSFLGSIAEIAAGNIGAAAQALESGLARGLKLVIAFLAKFLRLDGITARIRKVLDTIRAKVDAVLDRVANWVVGMAKKAGKLGRKQEPTVAQGETPPKGATVTATRTLKMAGHDHTLTAQVKNGKLRILMASSLQVELFDAIDAALKTPTVQGNPELAADLGTARKMTRTADIEHDWYATHADPMPELFLDQRLAMIQAQLIAIGTEFKVAELTDLGALPPEKRYLPAVFREKGVARHRLYERLLSPAWSTIRDRIVDAERPVLLDAIDNARSKSMNGTRPNADAIKIWEDLKTRLLIPEDADMAKYDRAHASRVVYHVDHEPPLAKHWQGEGYKTGDAERAAVASGQGGKLTFMTEENNLKRGSDNHHFWKQPWVALSFTSIYAEGGIPNAKRIDKLPFTDANGVELK